MVGTHSALQAPFEVAVQRREVFPDFFILGAAKCATTSVHYWLSQHSQICMSEPKEPFFFTSDFELGLDHYWETYFSHYRGEKLVAEASHRNLYHPHVAERIKATCPDAKFLLFFRNPVDRALSHWWHMFGRGKELLHFEDAIWTEDYGLKQGSRPPPRPGLEDRAKREDRGLLRELGVYRTYLSTGYYAEQLERYYALFPRAQFKITLMEDIKADTPRVLREILEFVGADPSEAEGFQLRPKVPSGDLKIRLRNMRQLRQNLALCNQGSFLSRLQGVAQRPKLSAETRAWLVDHFRPHNEKLAELIGRPLDSWSAAK